MIRRIRRKLRNINEQLKSKAIVLMYHRVIDLPHDPFNLAVSPDNFAQQMAYLKQHCQPMRLAELTECIQKNNLPRRAVVVTFDDGYFDNLTYAHPILEAAQIPWTLFVTDGFIDSNQVVWSDELAYLMLNTPRLPERGQLQLPDQVYAWTTLSHQERLVACLDLQRFFLPLRTSDRDKYIADLFNWAGIKRLPLPDYRMMTSLELAELAQSKFLEIGGHTQTHPFLTTLSLDEQLTEIAAGREKLASKLDKPVKSFAYPFGDYSSQTVDLVKQAGFEAAVTVEPIKIKGEVDLYQLGRFQINNWDVHEFSQRINNYLLW
ncbi:MAG: polysaccharide deacetylase family protein [Chloroflexi bacterium]|nr:MAG: polysaccharide deacetylase family protein [Chloroflexota bacterium]